MSGEGNLGYSGSLFIVSLGVLYTDSLEAE